MTLIALPQFELFSLPKFKYLDKGFFFSVCLLVSLGIVMVATSSMDFAAYQYNDPWFFVKRQSAYIVLGLLAFYFVLMVPTYIWDRYSGLILIAGIFLLLAVLIPGIGKMVNGSRRWLSIGPLTVQASEVAKFCLIIFFASYLSRRNINVQRRWSAFFIMILLMGFVVFLLLLEPDFGSSVVISATLATMMFVAGVPIFRFLLLIIMGASGLAMIAILSPYRWERLVTFMDPWQKQFDSGYQLVQSLIAFGRGEWTGLGLGNSIQKLFFLPEAHTDFIFSIYAEEFGFIGVILLIVIYVYFISVILKLARKANRQNALFSAYLVFGIASMLAMQIFINMGVASGFLPTKGLTLPFLSYGGSSLLITFAFIALVFRVNIETEDYSVPESPSTKKSKKSKKVKWSRQELLPEGRRSKSSHYQGAKI